MLICAASPALADSAYYRVTFEGTWTAKTSPMDYPSAAHFSPLIGATHSVEFALMRDGGLASPGIKAVAEMGKHSPLDQELRAAMDDGKVGTVFTGSPIKKLPGKTSISFNIDDAHPQVSFVTMIAPSPDWFAGVFGVSLMEKGKWVTKKQLVAYGWDAGTDSGKTFLAPDEATNPPESVRLLAAPQFWSKGRLVPVGVVTFVKTKLKKSAQR